MHLVEISIFSLNNVTVRLTKIMDNLLETSQNSDFQSHFSVWKIDRIFPTKKFFEEYWTDQLLLKMFLKILIFKILYFLKMCPNIVSSVHNFGRSDSDII